MLKEIECDDSVKSIACSHFIHITENDYETILSVGLENGTLLVNYIVLNNCIALFCFNFTAIGQNYSRVKIFTRITKNNTNNRLASY